MKTFGLYYFYVEFVSINFGCRSGSKREHIEKNFEDTKDRAD